MRMLVVPWLMCAACSSGKDYDWNLGAIEATSGSSAGSGQIVSRWLLKKLNYWSGDLNSGT
jgi:hypothetical protein